MHLSDLILLVKDKINIKKLAFRNQEVKMENCKKLSNTNEPLYLKELIRKYSDGFHFLFKL